MDSHPYPTDFGVDVPRLCVIVLIYVGNHNICFFGRISVFCNGMQMKAYFVFLFGLVSPLLTALCVWGLWHILFW